ncbi:class I SAM-dependent methyltransferase [candidate division KSB1 bacterium]
MNFKDKISENIAAHNNMVDIYDKKHGEIFNPIEQERLHRKLNFAISAISSDSKKILALDYGCGTGNITNHLIDLNINTISADVTKNFLHVINKKFSESGKSNVLLLNGYNLSSIKDNKFDLVVSYSVLHHIPDYLKIIEEFIRVLKPGGVIFIDHENSPSYWNQTEEYREFIQMMKSKWKRYLNLLKPKWYFNILRLLINPRYQAEGDIHVFPDDHIEWDKIRSLLTTKKCETILEEDFLLYKRKYSLEHYLKYKDKCSDMRLLISRK